MAEQESSPTTDRRLPAGAHRRRARAPADRRHRRRPPRADRVRRPRPENVQRRIDTLGPDPMVDNGPQGRRPLRGRRAAQADPDRRCCSWTSRRDRGHRQRLPRRAAVPGAPQPAHAGPRAQRGAACARSGKTGSKLLKIGVKTGQMLTMDGLRGKKYTAAMASRADRHWVYHRTGEPCRVCGTPIVMVERRRAPSTGAHSARAPAAAEAHTPGTLLTDPDEIRRLIRENPWATFVSHTDVGLVASHYPVLLDDAASTGDDIVHREPLRSPRRTAARARVERDRRDHPGPARLHLAELVRAGRLRSDLESRHRAPLRRPGTARG